MSIYATQPLTLGAVHTYPLASRKSKVNVRDFAKPPASNASLAKFLDSLPDILAASDLRKRSRGHAARSPAAQSHSLGHRRARHQGRAWAPC